MFGWLGTLSVLTLIFYGIYILLKKVFTVLSMLSPKKREILHAKEEWLTQKEVLESARKDMEAVLDVREEYFLKRTCLHIEDFELKKEYYDEFTRLMLEEQKAQNAYDEAQKKWEEEKKKTKEALERYQTKKEENI